MDPQREKFLNLKTAPARLNVEEAAWYLGFAPHDIPILVARGLLKALGHPADGAIKFFAFVVLQELRSDPKWLARATDTIMEHWRGKNARKSKNSERPMSDDDRAGRVAVATAQ
jgi:hypothetical protein